MRVRRFEWGTGAAEEVAGAREVAREVARKAREWALAEAVRVDLREIEAAVAERGDAALTELTARYDASAMTPAGDGSGWIRGDGEPWRLAVSKDEQKASLAGLDAELREGLEVAIANVGAVAEAQVKAEADAVVELPQGQRVTVREVPVGSAGIYAPGGGAAYPSSLIMGAVPARVAGVQRVVACTPPGPDGHLPRAVLAAAALCGVDELYAVGGAQAIFALARGTETIAPVDVIAGPGSARVQEAKRAVFGEVGIDSIAGPSELMVIADGESRADWVALDICAQAEHGSEGLLLVAAEDDRVLDVIAAAVERAAASRSSVTEAPLALVRVPGLDEAVALAQAVAPEHLQLDLGFEAEPAAGGSSAAPGAEATASGVTGRRADLLSRLTTAGCVFTGRHGATAFGDYAAGSNHVLPTGGAGRFSGPLGPSVFRRRISNVEIGAAAAAGLAPHVDRLAREEGLPVHGESARARAGSSLPWQDGDRRD